MYHSKSTIRAQFLKQKNFKIKTNSSSIYAECQSSFSSEAHFPEGTHGPGELSLGWELAKAKQSGKAVTPAPEKGMDL